MWGEGSYWYPPSVANPSDLVQLSVTWQSRTLCRELQPGRFITNLSKARVLYHCCVHSM